jgi:tetratricopeptide (TPR) repeat protein
VGIGITALLWFLLSPDLAFGDPPPETTPTPDGVPAPQKNTSGFDRLIEAYTSVIRDTPNSANAYALRGATKYAKGDLAGALADVEQALMLDPRCSSALGSRAAIRQKKGDFNGANEDLTTLALASRAECELQLNNLDAARLDYNKALELDPVSAIALQGLGLIALHAQDPKTALTYFNRAIQLNLYPPPYVPRAVAEIALESYHDAILDLSQAERLDPKNQDGPETLLWVEDQLARIQMKELTEKPDGE